MLVLGLVMFAVIDEFDREEFPEFQEELRNFILDRYKVSVEKFFVDKGLGL
jgi:hypothetical protein